MLVYWLWFAMLVGLSPRQKLALLERFSDPEEIYNTDTLPGDMELDRDLTQAQTLLRVCRRKNIGIVPFADRAYPSRLRSISDPPLVLYYKGMLPDFEKLPVIGVVGTRKATPYGQNTAKRISAQIAACGGLVISGGALGIDTWALQGALEEGAPTVAVLGCGVDVAYPRENRPLFTKIAETGCLLSEYPPGTGPKPWHFPARNRIISGMGNGVLVVEAPAKSGALITARDAMEQGRDVYAVPGNVDVDTCTGSNMLLQEGAYAAFSGWDTLKAYEAQYPGIVKRNSRQKEMLDISAGISVRQQVISDKKDVDIAVCKPYSVIENTSTGLTEQEVQLLSCMDRRPVPVDAVIAKVQLPTATVLSMLTKLALRGLVVNHPGKLVSRK